MDNPKANACSSPNHRDFSQAHTPVGGATYHIFWCVVGFVLCEGFVFVLCEYECNVCACDARSVHTPAVDTAFAFAS